MKGDFHRYIAEYTVEKEREMQVTLALESYSAGSDMAKDLHPANSIRLGLFLNLSVFLYECMDTKEEATDTANKAISDALNAISQLSEQEQKEANKILDLLKSNIELWKEEDK